MNKIKLALKILKEAKKIQVDNPKSKGFDALEVAKIKFEKEIEKAKELENGTEHNS